MAYKYLGAMKERYKGLDDWSIQRAFEDSVKQELSKKGLKYLKSKAEQHFRILQKAHPDRKNKNAREAIIRTLLETTGKEPPRGSFYSRLPAIPSFLDLISGSSKNIGD